MVGGGDNDKDAAPGTSPLVLEPTLLSCFRIFPDGFSPSLIVKRSPLSDHVGEAGSCIRLINSAIIYEDKCVLTVSEEIRHVACHHLLVYGVVFIPTHPRPIWFFCC